MKRYIMALNCVHAKVSKHSEEPQVCILFMVMIEHMLTLIELLIGRKDDDVKKLTANLTESRTACGVVL